MLPAMPMGVALMMTSKVVLATASFLMVLAPDWRGELLRGLGGAVEDEDLGALVAQAEDGGAGRSAGAEDEDLGAAQRTGASRAGMTMPATSVLKP